MASFTRKKKLEAVSSAMSNIAVLTRAIRLEAIVVKENLSLINDPDGLKAFKEMLNKCNFYTTQMDKSYSADQQAKLFLKEKDGESPIDELSLRVLDELYKIVGSFKI